MFSRIKLIFLLLFAAPLYAAPTVTVTATSATILGTSQSISLTCVLTDPNQTGVLRSGANVITVFSTSTVTPAATATCGPLYGNDVITDGFGNASTTYYLIGVYTVHNGIVDSAPSLLQAYQFAGSGTFDLSATLPFSLGPVSPAGSVLGQNLAFTGNNTHSGTETFTGPLNSNNLTTGNVANKPATADAVRFVTVGGSDSNDGLSWGTAKATISAAVTSLPTCTPSPSSNNSVQAFSGLCGTVFLGANGASSGAGYAISSPLIINSMMVRIVGIDKFSTQIQCTTSPCIEFNGANLGGSQFSPNPILGASGGLDSLSLIGNGSASQIGLYNLDAGGINHRNVRIANFNGTSAIGEETANDANGESERIHEDGISYDNNTINLDFTASNAGGLSSIAHQFRTNLQFTLNNGQTAIRARNFASVACEFCTGVINTNLPVTNTYTGVTIANSASIVGFFQFVVDNGAVGIFTATSGTTASNFKVNNWNPNGVSTTYVLGTQDSPFYNNVTASNASNGVCFQLSGVVKDCIGLDGSNFLGFFNATPVEVVAVSNAAGGGLWFTGSVSGAVNILPAAAAGGAQTFQNATGNISVTIVSGTSTLTANAALAAVTSQAAITTAATGALTTDAIEWSYASAPTAGDSLCHVSPYVTAGNVNFVRTNPTAAAQNVSALVINWRIVR